MMSRKVPLRYVQTTKGALDIFGYVDGGFQMVVYHLLWWNDIPLPPSYLNLTLSLPQFNPYQACKNGMYNTSLKFVTQGRVHTPTYRSQSRRSGPKSRKSQKRFLGFLGPGEMSLNIVLFMPQDWSRLKSYY